ncbi:MAG: hypothetical protein CMI76_01575 [Candidatus Pelagibacter sp.]|nr:hypothetical protein [Candidatus Pelagibacter sp.]|tara:strand:+ start:44 stop:586 length:543 start_codon:yes stop_codon:yes gene_type:complete
MRYEVSKLSKNNISLNRNQVFSVVGLYCFALGTSLLGFSVYLFLESSGFVSQTFISWSGQGLFWSLITFFISIFILFIPVEFLNEYFIENRSFRNLLTNIISVIFVSLFFLVVLQVILRNQNIFINEYLAVARAVSFSGFIAIPLVLFIFHNFGKNLYIINKYSYSLILIIWIFSTQIFL